MGEKNSTNYTTKTLNYVINIGHVQMPFLILCFHTWAVIHFSTSNNEGVFLLLLFFFFKKGNESLLRESNCGTSGNKDFLVFLLVWNRECTIHKWLDRKSAR